MDQVQPLPAARFLELLNKPNRSMDEENELQIELKRQEAEKNKDAQPADPGTAAPVESQPANPEPAVEAQPAPETPAQPEQTQEVTVAYDLTQLREETETAIAFLESQPNSIATEMAKSAFTQAAYWTKLASEGK